MANLSDVCLFPGVAVDTCFEDTLADEDFLKFLQDTDLTGSLPAIPDVCHSAAAAWDSNTFSSAQPAFPTAVVTTQCPQVAGLTPLSAMQPLPGSTSAAMVAGSTTHPYVGVQQPMPMRALSVTSSDASAAAAGLVAVSAPGSPVSSIPTCSSDTSGHPPLVTKSSSTGTSRQRQSSTGTAAASQQSEQLQPQKPLTKQQIAANKRRAPEVDWRSIDDPAERRRQRRLAKNRVTAARSRERKKEQMAEMEDRMAAMEQENSQMRALLASLAQENSSLKEQLASLTRGASPADNIRSSPEPAVLKCLAIMHLVCCLLVVKASFLVVASLVSVLVQQSAFGMPFVASCSSPSVLEPLASSCGSQCRGSMCAAEGCHWHGTRPRLRHELCCLDARLWSYDGHVVLLCLAGVLSPAVLLLVTAEAWHGRFVVRDTAL